MSGRNNKSSSSCASLGYLEMFNEIDVALILVFIFIALLLLLILIMLNPSRTGPCPVLIHLLWIYFYKLRYINLLLVWNNHWANNCIETVYIPYHPL